MPKDALRCPLAELDLSDEFGANPVRDLRNRSRRRRIERGPTEFHWSENAADPSEPAHGEPGADLAAVAQFVPVEPTAEGRAELAQPTLLARLPSADHELLPE